MVKETKTRNTKRSPDVVARDFTINLHKRLHGWYPFLRLPLCLHVCMCAYGGRSRRVELGLKRSAPRPARSFACAFPRQRFAVAPTLETSLTFSVPAADRCD
jgi:hypothetical protein